MRRAAALATLALAGCTGAGVAGFMPGETVEAGGDVFTVVVEGRDATARNFATGARNQERLYTNAQEAITRASGCTIASFAQDLGANTYRARLDCA